MQIEYEPFDITLAKETGADRVDIEPCEGGTMLRFWRGDNSCERIVTDAESDQPWGDLVEGVRDILDGVDGNA